MINRERKVDVTKMSTEQVDVLAEQIGIKLRELSDKAVEEANEFLKIYGLTVKMQLVLTHNLLDSEESDK